MRRSPCCWHRPCCRPWSSGPRTASSAPSGPRSAASATASPARGSRTPGGPPSPARYVKHQLHEAVDLEGEAGECVFAAYTGRVVEVERGATGVRGNLTIDHHPAGTGLVSRYLHLDGDSICVEPGEPVTKGDLIGQLRLEADRPAPPLRAPDRHRPVRPALLVRPELGRPGPDAPAVPVRGRRPAAAPGRRPGGRDPHRDPGGRAGRVLPRPDRRLPHPYGVPLYEPTTEHERGLIALFTKALELVRPVEVEFRDSVFFGDNRVPASVVLT